MSDEFPAAASSPTAARAAPPGPTGPGYALLVLLLVAAIIGVVIVGLTRGSGSGEPASAGTPTPPATTERVTAAPVAPPTPYVGPGSFRFWVVNEEGIAARWNPCEPVRWVFNPAGAPAGALADLQQGFARVSDETGLDFTFEGHSDEEPSRERRVYQPERYGDVWAPVLIAYVSPGATDLPLDANDRGVTVPVAVEDRDEPPAFITGQVVFNGDRDLQPGFTERHGSWGATVLHELGHLVGLDHVDDEGELMHEQVASGPVSWGPGDRAGLERLGGGACLTAGEPRPLEVRLDFG